MLIFELMKMIYNIICLPSLLFHELLHILMAMVVLARWKGIKIDKHNDFNKTFGFTFTVFTVSRYKWQNTLIHMAPFLAFMLPLTLVVNFPYVAIGIWIYQVITFPVIKPSDSDFIAVIDYKTNDELIRELYKELYTQKKPR